jgi:aminoglycoside phosphotransferase (APT) family kinase protein
MASGAATDSAPSDEAPLWRWVAERAGGELGERQRLTNGNSRTTWAVDVRRPDGSVELVVRTDEGDGPFSDTPLSLSREATVYRALDGKGLRVPRFYGFDEHLGALAIERASGREAWDADVLDALLRELGQLHALDPDRLDLPGFGRRAIDDLELWAEIAQHRIVPVSPIVELAIERLREHFPGEPERRVLVHGDAGPANLLWHDGTLSAMLDWEFAHLGDPADELAFITVRAALFGYDLSGFGAHVRRSYTATTGTVIGSARLRYWQIVGVLRNLITCLSSISNPVRGRDRLVHHMLIPSLDRLIIGQLAALEGVELEPAPALDEPRTLPGADVMSEIAGELPRFIDAIEDSELRQRARRVRYLFSQLADTWPLAFAIAAADAAEPAPADTPERLRRLARIADRRLALFPRARPLAEVSLAGLD